MTTNCQLATSNCQPKFILKRSNPKTLRRSNPHPNKKKLLPKKTVIDEDQLI